jgi:putative DNA primase/helicase
MAWHYRRCRGAAAATYTSTEIPKSPTPAAPDRWRHPWERAKPIRRTLAETYLAARGLHFEDPEGRVLRFAASRARKNPAGELEYHPAMLSLLSDLHTGEPCGVVTCYLLADGSGRIRDKKGKTSSGRAGGAVALLSPFCEPTGGLTICEGVETGIALLMAGLAPVWACGGMLGSFPVIGGIESLTIAADADEAGERKAVAVAERWQAAGSDVLVIAPRAGDWAAPEAA